MKKIPKTEAEWKRILPEKQYHILREKGTEQPFSGRLLNNKQEGTYRCAACNTLLFDSKTKFDSGTGWPSFYDANQKNIETKKDFKLLIPRIEILCKKCKSHLGHIFNDGPQPTGKRYCINSFALNFRKRKNENN